MYVYSRSMPTRTHTLARSYAFVLRALIVVAFLLRNAIRFSHRRRVAIVAVRASVRVLSLSVSPLSRCNNNYGNNIRLRLMRLWYTLPQCNDLILLYICKMILLENVIENDVKRLW